MKTVTNETQATVIRQMAEELLKKKSEAKILELIEELAFQNEDKAKRADELLIANKELAFQNEEKIKRAAELIVAKEEIAFQAELILANNKALKLSHQLEIHQIELETRNDELIEARSAALNAAKKYLELYDSAPTGYLSLSNLGKITEINQCAAKMLGKERLYLQGIRFGVFVSNDTKPIYNRFFDKIFNNKVKESCELTLSTKDNKPMYIQLDGVLTEKGDQCLLNMVDITEGKQAEEERIHQSALISMLLDSIPDIIFYKDTEGVYLGCNPPFAAFVGKSRNEIIGKTDYDLFDKYVAGFFRHHDKEMLKQKLPRHNEEWITFPDGRMILIDTLKTPYWASDGSMIGILGISRDITASKEAENKVKESEDRFNKLAEHSRAITWEVDPNGLYTYISDVCLSVLGYEPQEVIEKLYFYDFHPEQGREAFKEAALEIFSCKEHFRDLENALESKAKQIIWVATNGMPMLDDNGQLTGYRGTDTDITARKQMEEQLKQTSARLSMATHAGGVGIWDYDIVNNILLWDDQMIALYGLDKKNFSGAYEAWLSGVHPDDLVRSDQEIQMAISGNKDFNTEFRVLWPDGTVRYIRALAMAQRDDSGKALRMIGTNWDITTQKNAEQALLESKEILQKINAEKDMFFSIIAHDLRSPFNVFLNFSQMLAEDLPTMEQDQIQRLAVSMQNSATNLFRLLENLLEWSLMQRGITRYEPESCLLMTGISESMTSVIDAAKKKGIQIIYHVPEDLVVFADENMLRGIIRNLATNAVKFTPKSGTITITGKKLPNKSVEISIKDTGIGMSREMIDNLFKLDVNTSRKGTENEPSTGLGLIICKDLIEKHGGKLLVESEEGKSSTFYFRIPYKAEVHKANPSI